MKQLFILTIGCQMNVVDSDRMAAALYPLGYERVDSAGAADLILVNTCAIRAKAEQKLFSYLGRLAELKKERPGLAIGVGGCVGQQEGRRIFQRAPYVDLVFGTDAIDRLPEMVARVLEKRQRLADTRLESGCFREDGETLAPPVGAVSRFVTIMQGCDNFCSYCVVPYVRGRERSRPMESVVTEIRRLAGAGVREVTLLGQNVNSYRDETGKGGFVELLHAVAAVAGIERIRFTTSHPKDLSRDLVDCFGRIPELCPHFHLPVQSGSDRILERMNRRYTQREYLEKVAALRETLPRIAITSDIIVGFPGESQKDYEKTLSLIRDVGFDGLFAFMYSDRPNAAARRFKDKIPETVKAERLKAVLDLQSGITEDKNRQLAGSVQAVLVEGKSRRADSKGAAFQWSGRTPCNRIVNFTAPLTADPQGGLVGRTVPVRIERGLAHSLSGRWVEAPGAVRP